MSHETHPDRLDIVDALRGFALAGIVIAHILEQYLASPRPKLDWWTPATPLDSVIGLLDFMLIVGKFYSIFALLFGMSFAIMMGNAARKGHNFSGRFLWRLTILLGFGLIHSLIYRGDILVVYVLIGFFLPLFYGLNNRWLWAMSAILFLGAGRILFFAITGQEGFIAGANTEDSPAVIHYVNTLKFGSFWDVVRLNVPYIYTGKLDYQFGIFGRGYFTLAYFLVGMWLVRSGIVYRLAEYKSTIKKVFWWALGIGLAMIAVSMAGFATMPKPFTMSSWHFVLAYNFAAIGNIAITALLISGFLLLYLRKPQSRLRKLAPYGRMALTNYIVQSIIGTAILYGWGFGLLGEFHQWQLLIAGIVFIALQVAVSQWWLKHFNYGPLEWLWRCATWFSVFRLTRAAPRELHPAQATDR
ncbi:DUF418 domain-containing protein [Teredinibacter turnerae]|uniref:DUF418 domain-containing protein n=1 Tax=Teredinibacter turnerae TaxID=2426 RepID=UPI00037E1294|nr:DUF418 domain-containing protein [Teredinibacter turnerae]